MPRVQRSPKGQPKISKFVTPETNTPAETTAQASNSQCEEGSAEVQEEGENIPKSTDAILSYLEKLSKKMDTNSTLTGLMVRKIHELTEKLKVAEAKVSELEAKSKPCPCHDKCSISILQKENLQLKTKVRENNVIVHGLVESADESEASLRSAVTTYMKQKLKIPDVSIDHIYRTRSRLQNKPRPVKIRLLKLSDKEKIMKARKKCYELIIHEDLPPEGSKVHKLIGALVGHFRNKGRHIKFRGDHAILDGKIIDFVEAQALMKEHAPKPLE